MTSGFYKYLRLVTNQTSYAHRMNRLSNQIFGEVVRPTKEKDMRPIRLLSKRPIEYCDFYVNYYPRHVETELLMKNLRYYGLFRDEHKDFNDEMRRQRKLRGKEKTKKGEGKRSAANKEAKAA